VNRRDFITLLSAAAVSWPLGARAQQTYRLGILSGRSRDEANFVAFFDELRQVRTTASNFLKPSTSESSKQNDPYRFFDGR
jgi:hypothetical protein